MAESTNSLYREVILEHSRNPRNATPVVPADFSGTAHNPLCGDEVELTLALGEGKITRVGVRVRGCAIAQAAASLMSEIVPGWSLEDARDALAPLKTFLEGKTDHLPRAMEPLLVLEAIRKNTSRLNCALLGWQAFQSGTLTPTPEK